MRFAVPSVRAKLSNMEGIDPFIESRPHPHVLLKPLRPWLLPSPPQHNGHTLTYDTPVKCPPVVPQQKKRTAACTANAMCSEAMGSRSIRGGIHL